MNLKAVAYHLEERINLPTIRQKVKHYLIRREQSFLFYRVDDYSYIYFKDYGSIVFVNCNQEIIVKSIEVALDRKISINDIPFEKFIINIEKESDINIDFDRIKLPNLDIDFAHVIMLNMAQSVALDNYSNMTNKLLENTRVYALQLEQTGSIRLPQKKMKKFLGKAMNIKSRIAENLFIFDSPNLAWSTEELASLDAQLNKELDIADRHHGLQHNLNIVKENLDLFKDILHHKHSSTLEWIIILLILFEILQVITEKLIQ